MIDFSNEGPLARMDTKPVPMHATIGIGGGGVAILDQIRLSVDEAPHCYIIDTDESVVRGSVVEEKFLLGKNRVHGLGCGGDRELAERVWNAQEHEIGEMLGGVETAFVVTALGGATGTVGVVNLVRWFNERKVPVMVFAVTPFGFEERRGGMAAAAVQELRSAADAVFLFSAECATQVPSARRDIRLGLHEVDRSVAQLVEGLRRSLGQNGLSHLGWDDLIEVGRRVESDAGVALEDSWTTTGEGAGEDKLEEAVAEALNGVMLRNAGIWDHVDHLVATMSGGPDFSMSEFQAVLRALKRDLPEGFPIYSGAVVDPSMEGRLQLTLVLTSEQGNPCRVVLPEASGITREIHGIRHESSTEKRSVPAPAAQAETAVIESEEFHDDAEVAQIEPETQSGARRVVYEESADLFGHKAVQQYFPMQEELPLETPRSRGRFEKSIPTLMDGQDLDLPTFQRLKVAIRLCPES